MHKILFVVVKFGLVIFIMNLWQPAMLDSVVEVMNRTSLQIKGVWLNTAADKQSDELNELDEALARAKARNIEGNYDFGLRNALDNFKVSQQQIDALREEMELLLLLLESSKENAHLEMQYGGNVPLVEPSKSHADSLQQLKSELLQEKP